jgi:hypothetical protein
MKKIGLGFLAALIALMAFGIGLSTAGPADSMTVLPGEHIVLTASPSGADYSYAWSWTSGVDLKENGATPTVADTSKSTFAFDAPLTGSVTVSVLVNDGPSGLTCNGQSTFTINVCGSSVCPVFDATDYCATDTTTLTATLCHTDSSLTYYWIVNGGAPVAGTSTLDVNFADSIWKPVTATSPSALQSVEFKVIQTGTGHDPVVVFDCPGITTTTHFNPSGATSISHSP